MKPVLIICLGNPLMRDEGIGIRLASELESILAERSDVEVLDLGTGGLAVMHAVVGREKVIFVDCALMGEESGTLRRFTPDEVRTTKVKTRYSLHEGDLLNTLELSRSMGECPEDIVIFGIEPKVVDDGQELSPELTTRIDDYVEQIMAEL